MKDRMKTQRMFKMLGFMSICVFTSANYIYAETFKLTCVYKKGNTGAVLGEKHSYFIDSKKKLIRDDCTNCPWDQTIYWGDDYIVRINAKSNMVIGYRGFYQISLKVLNLETMVQYGVGINENTFTMFDALKEYSNFDGAPNFAVAECTRNITN